jgi:electron transport complex protein RnfA
MKDMIALAFGAMLIENVVLSQFFGICPFLGVSKKKSSAVGMGLAVTAVIVISSIVAWALYNFVLVKFDLVYLQTIVFILVIASLVQILEMFIKKVSPSLYKALGVFLPLITTNCCILGVAILVIQNDYDLLTGIVYAFATAIGFALAMILFAGIREQLSLVNVPKGMEGMSIALVTAGLLAMAFMGFSGVDKGLASVFGL